MNECNTTLPLKILIISHAVSKSWGGETILPYHIFKNLRKKGHEVWLCTSDENQDELKIILKEDFSHIIFIKENLFHKTMLWLWSKAPSWFPHNVFFFASFLVTSLRQRLMIPKLIKKLKINIVHQPAPVSPKLPCFITNINIPFIYGSMNGGMNYPPGFKFEHKKSVELIYKMGRLSSYILNFLIPGKRNAACLIVANRRTYDALPFKPRQKIFQFIENGVELEDWQGSILIPADKSIPEKKLSEPIKFIFIGALIPGKGVEYLVRAFVAVSQEIPATLEIIGDYWDERKRLEKLALQLGIQDIVYFSGFQKQKVCFQRLIASDIFVFPSLIDCGGAVILEAMNAGKPVIALKWGGAVDYINQSCGRLIPPSTPEQLIVDLKYHMIDMAKDRDNWKILGKNGKKRIDDIFLWSKKIDFYIALYVYIISGKRDLLDKLTLEFTEIN